MFNKKGEISTLVIIGVLSIIGVATLFSSTTTSNRNTISTQAACNTGYKWCDTTTPPGCIANYRTCPAQNATPTRVPTLRPTSSVPYATSTPRPGTTRPAPTNTQYPYCYPRENNNWCRPSPTRTSAGGGDIIRPTTAVPIQPSATGTAGGGGKWCSSKNSMIPVNEVCPPLSTPTAVNTGGGAKACVSGNTTYSPGQKFCNQNGQVGFCNGSTGGWGVADSCSGSRCVYYQGQYMCENHISWGDDDNGGGGGSGGQESGKACPAQGGTIGHGKYTCSLNTIVVCDNGTYYRVDDRSDCGARGLTCGMEGGTIRCLGGQGSGGGTNDEGNVIDQPTQDSLPPIFTGTDGGSCSGEGEWQIKCENKRGPCNFDAGVGIPYQCRSGKWVNANPSGECNRMCDTDGSSQQEIAQQQEQQTQQQVQDIRNNQQQTTNNTTGGNNTNTNTTGGGTYTSGITQTPIGGNSFTSGNGQTFNTTPRVTRSPATGSFSGGGGTVFNTTPRVTRTPVTKSVSNDGTTAMYEFPSNATGSKTTVTAKSGGEIKVKETNIVSGCDDRGGCFSPSVDAFIDTVSGANDPRYQDRANAYAQAAENNSQAINNIGSNIVNGITNSTVYKGVETIIQQPIESLKAAGEIGKAIVTDPVGSATKIWNGLFGN